MKKIFLFLSAALVSLAMQAITIPVWKQSTPVAFSVWTNSVAVPSSISSQLEVGDRLVVHVTAADENWSPIVLRQTTDPSLYEQFNVNEAGDFTIDFTSAYVDMFNGGFDITGDKVSVDGVKYIKLSSNESEVLWSVEEAQSFSWGAYAEQNAASGSRLAAGDQLKVHITAKNGEWPQLIVRDHSGNHVISLNIYELTTTYPYDVVITLSSAQAAALADGFDLYGGNLSANSLTLIKAPAAGDEKVLWEGSASPNWGNVVYSADATFSSLLANGDQISVFVSGKGSGEWPKVFLKGYDSSDKELGTVLLNNISSFPFEAKINLTSTMLSELKDGLLTVSGDDVTVTKVVYRKDASITIAKETTLWTGSITDIRWTDGGTQPNLNSYASFSGLQAGDAIKVYAGEHTTANAGYQFRRSDWSAIESGTVNAYESFSYVVATDEMAEDICNNGIILSGSGTYEIVQIDVVKAARMSVADTEDPSLSLSIHSGLSIENFTLNRTLYCDGYFNTLCLPFSLASLAGTPLEDATVMTLVDAEITGTKAGGDMVLDVTIDEVSAIEAGKPYLVSFPAGDNITSMTFHNVTITATAPQTVSTTLLDMKGIFAPQNMAANTDNQLFLGADNTLYWSDGTDPLKGFRAYFETNGSTPLVPARFSRPKNTPTGTEQIQSDSNVQKVFRNGQLFIIRDGKQYNVSGVIVK